MRQTFPGIQRLAPYAKRFIVMTLCVPLDSDMNKAEDSGVEALIGAACENLEKLDQNRDFVCFNIGNTSVRLLSDHQEKL